MAISKAPKSPEKPNSDSAQERLDLLSQIESPEEVIPIEFLLNLAENNEIMRNKILPKLADPESFFAGAGEATTPENEKRLMQKQKIKMNDLLSPELQAKYLV